MTQHCPAPATGQLTPTPHCTLAEMQAPLSHLNPAAQPVVLRSVHVVPHAVAETQDVFPGQGAEVVAAMQVPLPLHCPAGTKVGGAVPEHDGLPHAVPETWSRQAPTP